MAVVMTTKGEMEESLLEKRETVHENDNEIARATEYWLDGELVHRSVHVHLKKSMFVDGIAASFE